MGQAHHHTDYHPRWLRQPISTFWWLEKWSYFMFMLREASSIFVGWFAVYLLMLVRAVSQGEASYQDFLSWSAGSRIVLLNLVSLCFVLLHAVTFFAAAPQALVVRIGGNRVPDSVIGGAHYAGLVAASVVVAWILLGPE